MNLRTTPDAVPHLLDKKNADMLIRHGIYTEEEIRSRYEITLDNYCKTIIIEAGTMVRMVRTQIAPAVEAYAADVAEAAASKKKVDAELPCSYETNLVKKLSALTDLIASRADILENDVESARIQEDIGVQSGEIRDRVLPDMSALREACDEAETLTAKKYWPYPSYADLLFSVR